jgi:hypothetical protein
MIGRWADLAQQYCYACYFVADFRGIDRLLDAAGLAARWYSGKRGLRKRLIRRRIEPEASCMIQWALQGYGSMSLLEINQRPTYSTE